MFGYNIKLAVEFFVGHFLLPRLRAIIPQILEVRQGFGLSKLSLVALRCWQVCAELVADGDPERCPCEAADEVERAVFFGGHSG